MDIEWFGLSCFRMKENGVTVITDPYDKSVGYAAPKLRGEIVTVSHNAPGHTNVAAVKGDPKVLTRPGEYEVRGVFITGIQTWRGGGDKGEPKEENTVFIFEFGEITVCHLGDLARVMTQAQAEAMPNVDILMIPVGGGGALDADDAAEMISLLEPRIVIPMHYRTPQLTLPLEPVSRFLKEMGVAEQPTVESIRVSKSSLPADTQVQVLEARQNA